mmetsp:Transcript_46516/g.68309  ORF Transcript_46516/g.68309 Transcript_46516/m.68309 type:complete len:88 (+) Transcript_46516:71-334(+)
MVAGISTKGEVGGKGWSAEPADEEAGEQEVVRNVNVLSVETGEQMELAVMAIRATSPSRTQILSPVMSTWRQMREWRQQLQLPPQFA